MVWEVNLCCGCHILQEQIKIRISHPEVLSVNKILGLEVVGRT